MAEKTTRLMIVDDDDEDIYLIREAIEEIKGARYAVSAVTSPLGAMALLAKSQFDVILSDYRLGATTGIDFIKSVRAAGIDTPVILLTGVADTVIDQAALEAGAADFLPKSGIGPDVLDRTIRYALAHDERQRTLQAVLKSTNTGVALVSLAGEVTLWNPRFAEFSAAAFGEDRQRFGKLVHLAKTSATKDIAAGNLILEAHTNPVPEVGYVLALQDVTDRVNDLKERERAEQRIRRVAMEDGLTGLPNRMAFNDYLDATLERVSGSRTRVAVMSFDFNRFKEVNDLFGHAAGDNLLKVAAERLKSELGPGAYAARLGGDEFALIQICEKGAEGVELAHRIAGRLSVPLQWENKSIEAGISVGISYYPEHGSTREELLANADLAMYRAKSDQTIDHCVFDASMDQFVRERRKLAHDLKNAIGANELQVHFQPQFNSSTGVLTGFEALLRWKSQARGFVSPADFIPVAEENGLINEIDDWVLRQACMEAAVWPVPARVAVNISARAICQPGIAASVHQILANTGLSPGRLELEVTETALIQDLNRALHSMRQIKAMGVSIAMDDFGTGYSSLSLLNSFPFDRLKIDKSFVHSANTNLRTGAIFKTVVGLGRALNVAVLVEGVEDVGQHAFAQAAGCEEVQGYLFGRPMPAGEVMGLFARHGVNTGAKHFQSAQPTQDAFRALGRRLSA